MLASIKRVTDVAKAKLAAARPVDNAERYLVGLDIGTEYVKVLVGKVVDGHIEVVGVGKTHQGLADMQAGAVADIGAVVENCDAALNTAEQMAGVSARGAIIGIAGELVKGTTNTVRVTRKDPSKALDMPEIEQIIQLVQARAAAKAKQQLVLELGGKDIEVRLVNSALVSIIIDGYTVTNPVGFQGKEMTVQLYTAFAPLVHIGALEKVAEQLDLELLAVAAEPFAVARSVVGDDQSNSMSAVLMDVGGGTTDIAVIHDGGVQGTQMFSIGGRAYTRGIERDLAVDFDLAEQLKVGLSDGETPTAQKAAVEKALAKTLDVWQSGVELGLGEFTKLDHLPHKILLCGGGSSLQMLMDALHDSSWYTGLPFTRKPIVQYIQPDQVVGITNATDNALDHTFITAMGLLRVGLDTVQYNGTAGNSFREKIDRLLHV